MTQILGLCQADHKAVVSWYSGRRCMHEHPGIEGCVCSATHEEYTHKSKHTHTGNWSWVITGECHMVHRHSFRQTLWIFISLFILCARQTRQNLLLGNASLRRCTAQHTLTQTQTHTLTFTNICRNTLIVTHCHRQTLGSWVNREGTCTNTQACYQTVAQGTNSDDSCTLMDT